MAQVISLQGKYPLALAVTTLPRSQGQCQFIIRTSPSHLLHIRYFLTATLLAIAGTDRNVHIWTRSDGNVRPDLLLSIR